MKTGLVIAAVSVLAASLPALAQSPIPLHGGSATGDAGLARGAEVAQGQAPAYPLAPAAPPALPYEVPPPAPLPSYVWEPGHWSWNGVQYIWQPGKYVESPVVSATLVPGHWEQQPNGWVWVESHWQYPNAGSSTPPIGYPSGR